MSRYRDMREARGTIKFSMFAKIAIVGAGATGLGAAYRLQELNYNNWDIFERNPSVGGLASSFKDEKGFTWDMAGHAIFSHYEYVDKLIDKLLGDDCLFHDRNSWVYTLNRYIPYPFQHNLRYLPRQILLECLLGLIKIQEKKTGSKNFEEWILDTFGEGIAKYFMLPYNRKLWGYSLNLMSCSWTIEKISVISIERVLRNLIFEQDDVAWGDNRFRAPLYGGTGGLSSRFTPYIKDHLTLGEQVFEIDVAKKILKFSSGREVSYDVLINTMPLDQLIHRLNHKPEHIVKAAKLLKHNSLYDVGIGVKKPPVSQKCWIYFPEDNCCFHRVTYLSNYSPHNVPDPAQYYSLVCETSYSENKQVNKDKIIDKTIEGLVNTGVISEADKELIVSTHLDQIEYAYPIPTLETPGAIKLIQSYLESKGIYSLGRFGAWNYEAGNMDHCIMQGVEIVNKLILNQST